MITALVLRNSPIVLCNTLNVLWRNKMVEPDRGVMHQLKAAWSTNTTAQ